MEPCDGVLTYYLCSSRVLRDEVSLLGSSHHCLQPVLSVRSLARDPAHTWDVLKAWKHRCLIASESLLIMVLTSMQSTVRGLLCPTGAFYRSCYIIPPSCFRAIVGKYSLQVDGASLDME